MPMKHNPPDETPNSAKVPNSVAGTGKAMPLEVDGVLQHARPGSRLSWTWLFPLLALLAAGWLFFDRWQQQGPEIQVRFQEAPGIEAGKTKLIFRGTPVGLVEWVRLEDDLQEVVVGIRLKAFAEDLAREGTEFWIEQPEVTLRGFAGLDSLIQGNSIQARVEEPSKKSAYSFIGLESAPLTSLSEDFLRVELTAQSVPFLSRGTPVFRRGTQVGWVSEKTLDAEGNPRLRLEIEQQYANTVSSNTRFWILPAAALTVSPGQLQLSLPSLMGVLEGGINYDDFEPKGSPAQDGDVFELSPNEVAARADGRRVTIDFASAVAIRPGETRIYFLGQPVGMVESLRALPEDHFVRVTARLETAMSPYLTDAATFHLVRPSISWDGVKGLEAIVTGPHIAFQPGRSGEATEHFVALTDAQQDHLDLARENGALQVRLIGDGSARLAVGTPVYHRGLQAGAILEVGPSSDGGVEFVVGLHEGFRGTVRSSTRFWALPAIQAEAGPGVLEVNVPGLLGLVRGGIAFDHFEGEDELAEAAQPLDIYRLFADEAWARAISPPARISFTQAQGVVAGRTQLRFRGIPVGLVERVEVKTERVEVTARFFPGYDFLRRTGSTFAIVRPEISLQGAQGLETLLSGVYISCVPGQGRGYASTFAEWQGASPEIPTDTGFLVRLTTSNTLVSPGAPIIYNTMTVGEITRKELVNGGRQILLEARIYEEYAYLVKSNSIFWDDSSVAAQLGFFRLQVKQPTLLSPEGKVAFFTPEGGEAVRPGRTFLLQDRQPREAR